MGHWAGESGFALDSVTSLLCSLPLYELKRRAGVGVLCTHDLSSDLPGDRSHRSRSSQ